MTEENRIDENSQEEIQPVDKAENTLDEEIQPVDISREEPREVERENFINFGNLDNIDFRLDIDIGLDVDILRTDITES